MPIIAWWAIAGAGVLWAGKEAVEATGEAADKSANLAKWLAIGGALYVGYRLAKQSGALK